MCARALEASRHRVPLRDQFHDLLTPVGEGLVELREQPLYPTRCLRGEQLVHGALYVPALMPSTNRCTIALFSSDTSTPPRLPIRKMLSDEAPRVAYTLIP